MYLMWVNNETKAKYEQMIFLENLKAVDIILYAYNHRLLEIYNLVDEN